MASFGIPVLFKYAAKMDGVIFISHDHFLALKIASMDPVELRKASASVIHSLYSITFWGSFGKCRLSGSLEKCNNCWEPLNLISSRLIAGTFERKIVLIVRNLSTVVAGVFDCICRDFTDVAWSILDVWESYGTVPGVEVVPRTGNNDAAGGCISPDEFLNKPSSEIRLD